jgi:microcystin degradation protein MlrC
MRIFTCELLGLPIDCSTYNPTRARMEDFRAQRGQALPDAPFFSHWKAYPYPFQPTLLAAAVPGGPLTLRRRGESSPAWREIPAYAF